MRARPVAVGLVRQQQVAKVPFAEHDDMVDAHPTDRADVPFDVGVLRGPDQGFLATTRTCVNFGLSRAYARHVAWNIDQPTIRWNSAALGG